MKQKEFSDRRVETVRTGDRESAWRALLGLHTDYEICDIHYADDYSKEEIEQMGIDASGADAIFQERFPDFDPINHRLSRKVQNDS